MATHSSICMPGKCHGPRSLVGYSPWGGKELDTTEQLHFFFLSGGPVVKTEHAGVLGFIPG